MPSRSLVPEQSGKKRGRGNVSNVDSSNVKSTTPSTPAKNSTSSSNHKPRSSFSNTFFSSSPSTLWRRGPELESSTMAGGSSGSGSKADGKKVTTTTSHKADRSPRFWQKNYLVAYNLVSALLWAMVLGRVVLLFPVVGAEHVYEGVGGFVKWVQTGAVLEVVHSVVGLVRAPLITTVMQVASRLLLVWGVVDRHPDPTSPSSFYSSMLVAWSVTEVIRYGYFVMSLKGGGRPGAVPRALVWLRYNTFFVLYPLGITSEAIMVYKASVAGKYETPDLEKYALWAILAIYVPGSYVLYTHMMKQRRKVMGVTGRPRVDSVKSAQYKQ